MSNNPAIKNFNYPDVLEKIILESPYCHLALVDGDKPYIVGMNFGYENKVLYFHSAKEGKKIELLRKNNNVCVFFTAQTEIFYRHEQVACSWRQRYKSVQVFGKAYFIDDFDDKIKALKIFMRHYRPNFEFNFSKPSVDNIIMFKVMIESWSGRSFEY